MGSVRNGGGARRSHLASCDHRFEYPFRKKKKKSSLTDPFMERLAAPRVLQPNYCHTENCFPTNLKKS